MLRGLVPAGPRRPGLSLLRARGPPRARYPAGWRRIRGPPPASRRSLRAPGRRRRLPRGPVRALRRSAACQDRCSAVWPRSLPAPSRSLLRPGGLPGAGVPLVLAELPGHLGAARLPGRVRVARCCTGRRRRASARRALAVRACPLGGLAPARTDLTGLALVPDRARDRARTGLVRLSGGELTRPVARGCPWPGSAWPVPGWPGRPRLSLARRHPALAGAAARHRASPARAGRPRLLRRELAGPPWPWPGWYPGGGPLAWLRRAHRVRWSLRRLARPAGCLPGGSPVPGSPVLRCPAW